VFQLSTDDLENGRRLIVADHSEPNQETQAFPDRDFRRLYEFEFLSLVEHIWCSDFLHGTMTKDWLQRERKDSG
jgi:hypothetical protein